MMLSKQDGLFPKAKLKLEKKNKQKKIGFFML